MDLRKYELRSSTTWNGLPYIYDSVEGDDFEDGRDWYLADEADAALAAKDQRIAELEATTTEQDEHWVELSQKYQRLRAELFDDDSLEDIIQCGGGALQKHTIMEAQYALDLRRKAEGGE